MDTVDGIPTDEVLTVEEVSHLLKLSPTTIYAKVAKGKLPGAFRIGGATDALRFSTRIVLEWIAQQAQPPLPPPGSPKGS